MGRVKGMTVSSGRTAAFGMLAVLVLLALALGGCDDADPGGDAPAGTPRATATPPGATTETPAPATPGSAAASDATPRADVDFPTGSAMLVEEGYEPPEDHVASTGAFLPANGKPTLVYVDAIW